MVTINDLTNQGGLTQKEFELFQRISGHLLERVEKMAPRLFRAEICLKDRETRNQKVTLEVHLENEYFVASSEEEEIPKALSDVCDKVFAQINKSHDKHNRKQTRRRSKGIKDVKELESLDLPR